MSSKKTIYIVTDSMVVYNYAKDILSDYNIVRLTDESDPFAYPKIVEKTSLEIDALNGAPEFKIKWFINKVGYKKILQLTKLCDDNTAKETNIFTFSYPNNAIGMQKLMFFKTANSGEIVEPEDFNLTKGWLNIFKPESDPDTYSEMSEEKLMECSGKIKLLNDIKAYIKTNESDIWPSKSIRGMNSCCILKDIIDDKNYIRDSTTGGEKLNL